MAAPLLPLTLFYPLSTSYPPPQSYIVLPPLESLILHSFSTPKSETGRFETTTSVSPILRSRGESLKTPPIAAGKMGGKIRSGIVPGSPATQINIPTIRRSECTWWKKATLVLIYIRVPRCRVTVNSPKMFPFSKLLPLISCWSRTPLTSFLFDCVAQALTRHQKKREKSEGWEEERPEKKEKHSLQTAGKEPLLTPSAHIGIETVKEKPEDRS